MNRLRLLSCGLFPLSLTVLLACPIVTAQTEALPVGTTETTSTPSPLPEDRRPIIKEETVNGETHRIILAPNPRMGTESPEGGQPTEPVQPEPAQPEPK